MRTLLYFSQLFFILCAINVYAAQTCNKVKIATTPNSPLTDNGDGTVTDSKTGLMWKQCEEGLSGTKCSIGTRLTLTSQGALDQTKKVNNNGGFAGFQDWRLPTIKELRTIVEKKCTEPAINLDRFFNVANSSVWSSSPTAYYTSSAWYVDFGNGDSYKGNVDDSHAVRLVRVGQ